LELSITDSVQRAGFELQVPEGVVIAAHVPLAGRKRAPSERDVIWKNPPQTIISDPVHTAPCARRGLGAPVTGVELHESVEGV
jgi:hypothetical protein